MRLQSNFLATPTTRIVRVALDGAAFSYRAGQSASIAVQPDDPGTPYSIASAPSETAATGWVEFLVKVDGSNRFGARVSQLEPGIPLVVSRAAGRFLVPETAPHHPLLFIAGGTGIAPLRSMILECVNSGRRGGMALVYSARTPEEFAYLDELRALDEAGTLALTLTLTGDAQDWRHARGRAGDRHLAELATPKTMAFICGPPSMVVDIPQALMRLGVPREQIKTEDW
ncbi:MAG TPA: FAD-dependent oxidoreductase [Vicinamibacterales bacterium]|nr:FAD-dependent oxidoreductase [Vicinamibacterales bacterium]